MARNSLTSLLMLTLILAGTATVGAQERVDQRRPAEADGRVNIYNMAGSVKVVGWDRNEVRVQGTLGEGTERLDFTSTGGSTDIEVIIPRNTSDSNVRIKGSDLEISLPKGSLVIVRTVSASVLAETVSGELQIAAVSGGIKVRNAAHRIEAESISGDIEIAQAGTGLTAKSVAGRIVVEQVTGSFSISTVSGDISAGAVAVEDGRCVTLSGAMRVDATFTGSGTLDLESHSGRVELTVPADVAAEFDITTFSADIKNVFGQEAERRSRYGPGKYLRFTNGAGGARVNINAFSGQVIIRTGG